MSIQMLGIDHSMAPVDVRGIFSFTKTKCVNAMQEWLHIEGIQGVIILSTCNRMEIWADVNDGFTGSLYSELCKLKGVEEETFSHLFVHRENKEAIEHLFLLACGLKSQIVGEDQIISQVKDALTLARESNATNATMEVLFRMAVTAAKRVKTKVIFPKTNVSAIQRAISLLKEDGIYLQNKTCMVIGNGQMGKLAAVAFRDELANVYMTVRQYRHGTVELPAGCKVIDYDCRGEFLEKCDVIVSATTSPHYTLTKEMVSSPSTNRSLILIDLAVPRDIDLSVKELENVTLYDIDDFKVSGKQGEMEIALEKANNIIKEEMDLFYSWLNGTSLMPNIQYVKDEISKDMVLRLKKRVGKLSLEEDIENKLLKDIEKAAQNTVNKLIFGLKEGQDNEDFTNTLEVIKYIYNER